MTDSSTETIVDVTHVTRTFKIDSVKVDALSDVSLKITAGEQLAIVGKSGAGKSSLLHIIGLLDQPTHGSIRLKGQDLSASKDSKLADVRNREIGFVFQNNNLLPEFSAIENVMMPGLIARANPKEVRQRAEKLLEAVGLQERLAHRPSELSGGEMQRVAIARSLIMKPSLILADEPTGNLDQKTSELVENLLIRLSKELGITVVIVTHDQDLAGRLPRKIVMEDGKILQEAV